MRNYVVIGLSIPTATAIEIDKARGKINRSLYVREILAKGLAVTAAAGGSNSSK
jgi:hypothetical protein